MSTNEIIRRRAALHYGTGEGYDVMLGSLAPRTNYSEIPFFTICTPTQPFSVNGSDQIIFTRNLANGNVGGVDYGPVVVYRADFSYVDYYGVTGSQVDTGGRGVRKVTISGSARLLNFSIRLSAIDDTYVYNVTQGKYIFRGNNIPADYVPQLG